MNIAAIVILSAIIGGMSGAWVCVWALQKGNENND